MSIIVLSDKINSGKSSFCEQLAKVLLKNFQVNGWITTALMNGNTKIGQQILILKNGVISKPKKFFSYTKGFEPRSFDIGNFPSGDIFFMDELGPVEISKNGFFNIAKQMLIKNKLCFIVIRKGLVEKMCKVLGFKPDYVLNLDEARTDAKAIIENALLSKK